MTKAFIILLVVCIILLCFLVLSIIYLRKLIKNYNEAQHALEVASYTLNKCAATITGDIKTVVNQTMTDLSNSIKGSKDRYNTTSSNIKSKLEANGFTKD